MWYAIIGKDVPNSLKKRQAVRAEHLARLKVLKAEDRLLLAGPFPMSEDENSTEGFSGSLIVARFDSLASAQLWADADPYCTNGVYADVKVHPFKHIL